jgi:hypothetical protein
MGSKVGPGSFTTHVAGIPHRLGKDVKLERVFHVGQSLRALRESDNRHDSNAVKLFAQGRFVGYVARKDNPSVAQHMDEGEQVSVVVIAIDRHDVWMGVKIQIHLV